MAVLTDSKIHQALGRLPGWHPDIDVRYNKVTMSLVSHDSGRGNVKESTYGGADQSDCR